MPEWIPTHAARARGRLVLAALDAFGARGYEGVGVAELARAAETTTGPLYHHFGSKLGLYDAVRADVERRVTDRMEGALAASDGRSRPRWSSRSTTRSGPASCGCSASRTRSAPADPVAALLDEHVEAPLGALLAAAWRAALIACAEGAEPAAARRALARCAAEPRTEPAAARRPARARACSGATKRQRRDARSSTVMPASSGSTTARQLARRRREVELAPRIGSATTTSSPRANATASGPASSGS